MGESDRQLGHLAIARGLVSRDQVDVCLHAAKVATPPRNLGQVLVEKGLVTDDQLRDLLMNVGATVDLPATPGAALTKGREFGRYEILGEIGRGGMGAVYKAKDLQLGRIVALKILSDRYIATEDDIHRFQRESKLAARVRHPNLVPVYEAGIHDAVPFYTMEFVEGRTLDEILVDEFTGALDGKPGKLSRDEKVRIMIKVAEAIHVAHRAGIIHRDLKPANVIIDDANEPHVMDFGLAKELESITFLTSTGTAMGTPYYMPPEQARGRVRDLDQRTDVYAMGAVLYHALTLQLPFMENTAPMVLRKVLEEDPVAPRTLDPTIEKPLELIIFKAMAKEPRDRYQTAADFARDLERFLQGQPVSARGPSSYSIARRWIRRHPAWTASAAVSILLLTFFALVILSRPGRLTLRTEPAGAEVWIDGKRHADATPVEELTLSRGRHEIHLVKPGYRPITVAVDIAAGSRETRLERLEARYGRLSLTSQPTPVEVRLSGPQVNIVQTPIRELLLPEGTYRAEFFRLQYQLLRRELKLQDRVDVREKIELVDATHWKYRLPDGVHVTPAVADLDGDRIPDAVAVAQDGKVVALGGRDGRVLWLHDTRGAGTTAPVIVDAEGDGRPDVVLGVGGNGFLCLRGRDGASRYFVRTDQLTSVSPEAPDVNADRVPEILTGCGGIVGLYSGRYLLGLKPAALWTTNLGSRLVGPPRFNGEIIAVTEGRRVVVLNTAGKSVRSWDLPGPVTSWTLSGDNLVIVGGGELALWSLAEGTCRWSRPLGATPTAVSVGTELLVSTEEGFLFAFTISGQQRWKWKADQAIRGAAMWVDLDGDGKEEVAVGSEDRRIYALDGTGLVRWCYLSTDGVTSSIRAVDMTGDGIPEIVFGSRDGRVTAVSMAAK